MKALLFALAACGRMNFEPIEPDALRRCDPTAPFTSVAPIVELDTAELEGALRLSSDELEAYMHRVIGGTELDLVIATRSSRDAQWTPPTAMGLRGYWPTMSRDRLTLLYTVNAGTGLMDDIWIAERRDPTAPFDAPTPFVSTVDGDGGGGALLSHDNTRMYFGRSDAAGLVHLWVATFPGATEQRRIEELVTVNGESSFGITGDELDLYFATATSPGQPKDIFVAHRDTPDGTFLPPTPVPEVNSISDEAPTWLSADGCRLYFESNKTGSYDVYLAERLPP